MTGLDLRSETGESLPDVRDAVDVVEAFRRIATSGQPFVSRGDQSGTHERELALWAAAGTRPAGPALIVSGRGMGQALRHAVEARAYVLTDAPTLWQLRSAVTLPVLIENDPRLINTYAVVHHVGHREAETFASWLTAADGRAAIGAFTIEGRRGFEPWLTGCANESPRDMPCRNRPQ